ncbi:neuroligin-1-like [Artemia franciscana]|uniref:Carboxylesterase type B domain-containing protein n=1 Tax=Artemia franciscana TaxID=6661 RepID=A0AA88I2X1_ARTSF|nr:hypothetical protein QYM36_004791 [Artemia franciscana]
MKMKTCWIIFCTIISSASAFGSWSLYPGTRLVTTRKGVVRGIQINFKDKNLAPVEAFLGIPYASPPVGTLRFMPPVTAPPWRNVRTADKLGPVCPQQFPDISNETAALSRMPKGRLETLKKMQPFLRHQSEDCLHLNIYTPFEAAGVRTGGTESQKANYPVIVYIHGESYSWGSGNLFDGSVLASVGRVVVVTLNYRLGVLGFLNPYSDPFARSISNFGLMDQIAALHWLQENIGEFGGDHSSVTVMGHGTGAACITYLMTSPAVKEGMLFHRGIIMSGTALSPWALVQEPIRYATQLAQNLNCSTTDLQVHLYKCLRGKTAEEIIKGVPETPLFLHPFGPSVDGVVVDGELEYPTNKLADRLSRYDLIFGVAQSESLIYFSESDVISGIDNNRRIRLLRTLVRNTYQFHLQEILASIVNEYTDWEKPIQHPMTLRDQTIEAISDAEFVAPVVKTGDIHSTQRHNSYFYVVDYQTKNSDFTQRLGCIHGEDLPYVFGAPYVNGLGYFPMNYTRSELALSETFIFYWSNFARFGNPNEIPISLDALSRQERKAKFLEWLPYDSIHKKYITLGIKPKAKSYYRSHRLALWLSLIPELHRPSDVARSHHLFDDYDDASTYGGRVRIIPSYYPTIPTTIQPLQPPVSTTYGDPAGVLESTKLQQSDGIISKGLNSLSNGTERAENGLTTYSTALSVTIAIGCSLLVLNVLIFAGVYYQRDKQRMEGKRRMENGIRRNISHEIADLSASSRIRARDVNDITTMQLEASKPYTHIPLKGLSHSMESLDMKPAAPLQFADIITPLQSYGTLPKTQQPKEISVMTLPRSRTQNSLRNCGKVVSIGSTSEDSDRRTLKNLKQSKEIETSNMNELRV